MCAACLPSRPKTPTWLGWAGLGWAGLGTRRGNTSINGPTWLGWAGLGWAGLGWAGMGWDGMGWEAHDRPALFPMGALAPFEVPLEFASVLRGLEGRAAARMRAIMNLAPARRDGWQKCAHA
jgi:hypothetical protein